MTSDWTSLKLIQRKNFRVHQWPWSTTKKNMRRLTVEDQQFSGGSKPFYRWFDTVDFFLVHRCLLYSSCPALPRTKNKLFFLDTLLQLHTLFSRRKQNTTVTAARPLDANDIILRWKNFAPCAATKHLSQLKAFSLPHGNIAVTWRWRRS